MRPADLAPGFLPCDTSNFLPVFAGSQAGLALEYGVEGGFGIKSRIKRYCQDRKIIISGIFKSPDDFPDLDHIHKVEFI